MELPLGSPVRTGSRSTEDGSITDEVAGKVGRVTGTIAPGAVGEVMIAIRGGSEAFHAYAVDRAVTLERGSRVVVVEYYPPRTVVVTEA